MPLTVGGKITSLEEAAKYFKNGADKITLNTAAYLRPKLIKEITENFGSQSLVVSIDVKKIKKEYFVFIKNGLENTSDRLEKWIKYIQTLNIGEILINSIDRDGLKQGFDFKIYEKIKNQVRRPIIFCGGAGKFSHFKKCFKQEKINAVAAANIFHHYDQSYLKIKNYLFKNNILNVRKN